VLHDILFEVTTPLGIRVRTTESYWALIRRKHPEVEEKLDLVQQTLAQPAMIRKSQEDPKVFLFYKPHLPYWICVVIKRLNEDGFIVTAYLTDRIKEGEPVWPG